jgi:hypothetical protein
VDAVAPARSRAIGGMAATGLMPSAPAADMLQVFELVKSEEEWELLFVLSLEGKTVPIRDRSATIKRSRRSYVEGIYKEIQAKYPRTPVGQEASRNSLIAFGADLLHELVPDKIRDALWENRDRIKGIQILSEEAFIPWELVYLNAPRDGFALKPGLFLAEIGLVRWLHDLPAPPTTIHLGGDDAFYLIPEYAPKPWKLPKAQEEIPYLQKHLKAKSLGPSSAEVMRALQKPDSMSLFHFSGHGIAPTEADEKKFSDALMTLAGTLDGTQYTPDYLSARVVQSLAQLSGEKGRRPIVTLNACQLGQMQQRLHNVGGFTPAFIAAGAGVFTAAMWSIGDSPAKEFSEAFYKSFLEDRKTLAESVREGREAARKLAPDTWLSYAVYGHPEARVTA